MGIVSVTKYKKEGGQELRKINGFLVPRFNGTISFEVYTDTPSTVLFDVLNHASIPKLYSPHPEYTGAICKKVRAPQGVDDDSYLFDVTCEYDDDFDGADKEQPTDKNPLNRPTVIGGGFNEHEEIIQIDLAGNLIKNSALDPFDPPVTRKAGSLRFSMTKNYPTLNMALLAQYKNAINSDEWFGQAPSTVRIANISFKREIEAIQVDQSTSINWVYFPYTFEFEVQDPDYGYGTAHQGTWKKIVLDAGFREYVSGYKVLKDNTGMPVSKPVPLDGHGTIGDPTNPQYLFFDVYRSKPFASLNLL